MPAAEGIFSLALRVLRNDSNLLTRSLSRRLLQTSSSELAGCRSLHSNRRTLQYLQKKPSSAIRLIHPRTIMSAPSDFVWRQLFEGKSSTYTYLLADSASKHAILIDPVIDTVDRDVKLVQDLGLTLVYAINTHVHADHVTGTGEIKKRIRECKSIICDPRAKADLHIEHGSKITFGKFELECRGTPGHTGGCMTYVWHEKAMAFTGDALLIRGCGRTDFQEGDPSTLYNSVHNQIFSLPEHFLLYPAHDYKGQTVTSVAEEKKLNPRLSKTKDEFIKIMNELGLPYPKQIDKALPANMMCGVYDVPASQ